MHSAKKGLICNLNHVHLQHVSLGLHLSRHPELQEDGKPPALPSDCITCRDCQDHGVPVPDLVDANSNNPSLPCRCCNDHLLRSEVKQGLQQTQPVLPNQAFLKPEEEEEEEEEGVGSPSEPASSSASSCSDLSLDNSPVSVYCKPFPAEGVQSPENQPNIVPLEDAHRDLSGAEQEERSLNLNAHTGQRPASRVWDSPDSLCSSSSLDSSSEGASPCPQSLVETPPPSSSRPPLFVPPPPRPCRAPPAVPASRTGTKLDSNCNALPAPDAKPDSLTSGRVDVDSNHAAPPQRSFPRVPPPVPPRTKRGLQGLRRCQVGKPASEGVPPPPPPPPFCLGEPQSEDVRKNITSFHELAQKRKKAVLGLAPPPARKDQSDWLIVFSPETELPPCNELAFGAAPCQEAPGPLASQPEPANPTASLQRGVTTFKELRYRKQKGQTATKGGSHPQWPVEPCKGRPDGDALPEKEAELVPNGHFLAPKDSQPWKKKPRPGLQPIVEGGGGEEGEDGATDQTPPGRRLGTAPNGKRESWMPGKEEGGDKCFTAARHSQSFSGVPSAGQPWAPDANRASAQLQEQKKALLVAVSASVDKIVAHFSAARNLVQKAQLGDSRLSPDVGYLVLTTLCPALRALISDGLKPFQKDVITGQRPSSPWSVVEASVKPGPQARSLNALYWRISRLAPLRNNQQRFHAFILGLLNMKQLEQWFANLQQNSELISALYLPTAFFLVLSQGLCRRWGDDLLLLLQPLSVLTFQLDLLFEHQHLPLDVRPAPRQQAATPSELSAASWKAPKSHSSVSGLADGPLAQPSSPQGLQGGLPLHRRLLRWGDQLSQTFLGKEAAPKPEADAQASQQENGDQQRSWWKRLSEASGLYVNASPSKEDRSPCPRWPKRPMALGEVITEARTAAEDTASAAAATSQAPSPEGSGSGASKQALVREVEKPPPNEAVKTTAVAAPETEQACPADAQEAAESYDSGNSPGGRSGKWLGWLFGANPPAAGGCPNELDSVLNKSRRPSSWLPPNMNVLALVMKMVPSEKSWPEELWEVEPPDSLHPSRAVRALCDHSANEDGHLSFHKGDILQVLDMVDEDWIQCCHGERRGLVPVGYTSLVL